MYTLVNELERNKNFNGGGLATNITGKFESNRHAIARCEKYTFGEAAKELRKKKNGGLKITAKELLEIYRAIFGEPEWHHAGKLPKQYGGGMKKTYFLDEVPTADQVADWQKRFEKLQTEKAIEQQKENDIYTRQQEFLRKHGTYFSRLSNLPDFAVNIYEEMNGKYGWFEANYKYNMNVYYSGYKFESKELRDEYYNIK